MKTPMKLFGLVIAFAITHGTANAQSSNYTNFIRQTQMDSGVVRDVSVDPAGQQLSDLAIDTTGAEFELWTVRSAPLTSYLLDSKFVGSYIPVAEVTIHSEDPYTSIPRTRADRPFYVTIEIGGLLYGADDPAPSKAVKLYRHVQSYGENGNGENIDRSQATMLWNFNVDFSFNGTITLWPEVPSSNYTKRRGEDRISIFSIADYQAPSTELASEYVQIWPVAEATISGITAGEVIKLEAPVVQLNLNDLYPDSQTYAQVYQGNPSLDATGTIVPGSGLNISDSVPHDRVLTLDDYDEVFTADGTWTMEVLTTTPFGTDRLAYITFEVDRKIRINGQVTTAE